MTRRSLPRRGKRTPPCPGCKMAARVGAAWRGGHVLGSSARASLSDLYGSSRRTGAAERERGRVSSRAEPPLPRKPPLGPVLVFRGFFSSPPAKVYRITLEGPGECVAGDFRAVPPFVIAAPERVSAGSAPGGHPCEERTWRRMLGAWRRWRPGRRPGPSAGSGRGGARAARPETWRELGGDGPDLLACEARERCSLLLGDRADPVGVWLRVCRPFPAFEWLRGRAPLGAGEGASASATTSPHLFSLQ